jgi:DNA polymerase III sliding clamp (beta) subunit (PCNA family)
VGSQCITTDGIKMCINDINVLPEAVLIPQTLADLVGQLTESEVEIRRHENKLLFSTSNIIIFGAQLDGVEEYPDITEVLEFQYTDYVVVSKSELANALDRLSLFVDAFDNSGILLQFDKDSMTVTDQKGNSNEVLTYKERSKYKKTKTVPQVMLNIDYLRDMLNALSESHVNIQFGAELPIKIVEGNVTQILGTMEDAATETEEE